MKIAERAYAVTDQSTPAPLTRPAGRLGSSKTTPSHFEKLAVVYVRQSSPTQVLENRESTARQYALADYARALGWSAERVLVIDGDQGISGARADNRAGFQQLLAEVSMGHVGMVLGLEMSRLARSSKDWHHLLEICAIFGALLADQDGIYDPGDCNDRLLLGLKGTMSEVELHTMRNRLRRGALNKAQRGELFHRAPVGYVILPNGKIDLDPDEQARDVIRLVFEKFNEIGTIYGTFHWLVKNGVRLPVRAYTGAKKGELDWRRPVVGTLAQMLHNPTYAGAYAYGRRTADPKKKHAGGRNRCSHYLPMERWKVLIKDTLPAYLSWNEYLGNLERMRCNQNVSTSPGAPREGVALLPGLLRCGVCGCRMAVNYHSRSTVTYSCQRYLQKATDRTCYGLAARELEALVVEQVLRALEPAALALSLKACENVQKERTRLDNHWRQELKRARYDVDLAERRYAAVDPGNRLVASSLEKSWEEALGVERELADRYDRFRNDAPSQLSDEERARIAALATDIPALWRAAGTRNQDRQAIVRCLVDRVVVHVKPDSEYADASIHWKGGYVSQHEFIRSVSSYAQLRDFDQLKKRLVELHQGGNTAGEIAEALSREGFSPPQRRDKFTSKGIYQLFRRLGLIGREYMDNELLGPHEWWVADLSRKLKVRHQKLYGWAEQGWVRSRRTQVRGYWILWADDDEIDRLHRLATASRRGVSAYPSELTTPKLLDRATVQ